jgi:hypothetical protein
VRLRRPLETEQNFHAVKIRIREFFPGLPPRNPVGVLQLRNLFRIGEIFRTRCVPALDALGKVCNRLL